MQEKGNARWIPTKMRHLLEYGKKTYAYLDSSLKWNRFDIRYTDDDDFSPPFSVDDMSTRITPLKIINS